MKAFMDENFMLENNAAEKLYHDYAKEMPIIDYHCHLPPKEIGEDRQFENITRIWLDGDHYKWRAMRAAGVDEKYCTGNAPDEQKFEKWAETVPNTLRNPLYHWTHMELRKPFGITKILNPSTAKDIYEQTSEMLNTPEFSARNIMRKSKVEVVCTTDDPIDNLKHHIKTKKDNFEIKVLPTWRPDKAMAVENTEQYNKYLDKLENASKTSITKFDDLIAALRKRHDFFHKHGCRLSDHGLETMYAEDFTETETRTIFSRIRSGKMLTNTDIAKFKSNMLIHFAMMDHEKNWVQQFHLGALRNNSTRMLRQLGPDKGFDSMGDFEMAIPLSRFFDRLDMAHRIPKTILYNLNPKDNALFATMLGNFNDGSVPGKMQLGSGWWFLDQKFGMIDQINTLSSLGLLSQFVGMLTDSRSFLSYPRHDYFRRILCNLLGKDMENGEIPVDFEMVGNMVKNISYFNAKKYFEF
ncbi:MAG: glucuronate isomerase [Bacteroidota bacterium]